MDTTIVPPPSAPPASMRDWTVIARSCLIAVAAALFSAAAVFFFAANWWRISGWTKVAWIDAALLVLAVSAAISSRGGNTRSCIAFAGAMLSGVLFAVHGQIWQTGADAWTLFLAWAAAAIFWAAMSEATAVWLLAVILAAQTSILWVLDGHVFGVGDSGLGLLFPIAVLAAADVAIRLMRRRWPRQAPGTFLPVAIEIAAVTGTAVLGGGIGLWIPEMWPLAVAAALLIAGSLVLFRRVMPSPAGYATAAAAALAFVAAGGVRLVVDLDFMVDEVMMLLLLVIGVGLMFGVWALTRYLRGLDWPTRRGGIAISSSQVAAVRTAVLGAVTWLAAILACISFQGLTERLTDFGGGIVAAVVAIVLQSRGEYGRRVAGPLAVVAVWLLAAVTQDDYGLVGGAVVATIVAAAMIPLVLLRAGGVDAGFVLAAGVAGLWLAVVMERAAPALALAVPVLTGLGWLALRQQAPALVGAGAALLGAAFFAPSLFEVILDLPFVGDLWQRIAAVISAGVLVAATVRDAGWRLDLRFRAMIGGALAVCLVLPGGAAGTIGLFAVAAWRNSLGFLAFALALGGWSLCRFYYTLEQPLADKAVLMAVGAVMAIAVWAVMTPRPVGRRRPSAAALAGFVAIVVVAAAVEAQDGLGKAAVVRDGTRILLPMRPGDPRSLVQGDYMAIGYPRELERQLEGIGSHAILTLDAAGVVRSARRDDGSIGPNEVLARIHGSATEPRVAPTSFLFEEGTAETWRRAVMVEARVKGGVLVMTGLADADGKRLEPPATP